MSKNKNLHGAKSNKKDEFYTQLSDIQKAKMLRIFLLFAIFSFLVQSKVVIANEENDCVLTYEAENYSLAFPTCKKLAKQGNAIAQFNLGLMYHNGEGVEKNEKEAVEWYTESARQGNTKAKKAITNLACQGHAFAQYTLGSFVYGLGRPPNPLEVQEGLIWYELAAEQGYIDAQLALGEIYSTESAGVFPKSYEEALEWYSWAAQDGSAYAQYKLGQMNYRGEGVPPNYEKAKEWLKLAADQLEQEDVDFNFAQYALNMIVAEEAYRVLAELGHANAQYELGKIYSSHGSLQIDFEEADKWLNSAIKQGHIEAQDYLNEMYDNAYSYVSMTSETNVDARYNAGWMYANGKGVKKNDEESLSWYSYAAQGGHFKAQKILIKLADKGNADAQNYLDAMSAENKNHSDNNKSIAICNK